MLDILTKWGKFYYKMGSFLFWKTGQAVLQNKVGITEWHNFYYKLGGWNIAKWGHHYKEEKDNTKGFWLSFRATMSKRKIIVIAKSSVEMRYQTDGPPNVRKRSNPLFLQANGLKIFCLFQPTVTTNDMK